MQIIERFYGGKCLLVIEYYCLSCRSLIAIYKFDENRKKGNKLMLSGTCLSDNSVPYFCPFCGHKLNLNIIHKDYNR